MRKETLCDRLNEELKEIGLPVEDIELCIRPYSKTYYGNYFPKGDNPRMSKPRVYVYPCKSRSGDLYCHDFILDTAIHEMVHHLQYTSPGFIRYSGVMHDEEFWKWYNIYILRAKIKGVMSSEYKGKAA